MPNQFAERYAQLNPAQKKAVDTLEGPVLVVAGPGSGKTELLALRIANILLQADVYPGNILCLTFTDAAASNMRERLRGLIGETAYKVAIYTFHSFGSELISRYPEYFFQGATFAAADELAQIEVIEQLLEKLPHGNPLRVEHPEEGYIYLHDIRRALSDLKRAGLTPEEFSQVIEENAIVLPALNEGLHALFNDRLSASQFPSLARFIEALPNTNSLAAAVKRSLSAALATAELTGKTAALSAWKSSQLAKNDEGQRVLKDSLYLDQSRAMVTLYAQYQEAMYRARLFDFDDMLLRAIQTIESTPSLQAELQERYQYLLVDEFQDTNDAQSRLLHTLTDNPVNEGRPNILAVGDDDQAIYRFQGAEVANIMAFATRFRQPTIINLSLNYRSAAPLIALSQTVISQGNNRLQHLFPTLEKQIEAADPSKTGEVKCIETSNELQQYHWIAQEITRLQAIGVPLSQIAVISRRHAELQALLPHLDSAGLAVQYERQQNVLQEPHIHQVIQICRYLASLARHQANADYLLPEILSYPWWEISALTIWEVSTTASQNHLPWLEVMRTHHDPKLNQLATFFLDLAIASEHQPLEEILQQVIGAEPLTVADDADADLEAELPKTLLVSPFKQYYFSQARFAENRLQYLTFLSSLKTFIEHLRAYRQNEPLTISDLVNFVDAHTRNNLPILDKSDFATAADAVHLLTAHKAKGLEFQYVFVLSCQDEVWVGRARSNLIRFPLNLPIATTGDTADDHLRLFYVALTRAKQTLYLTKYKYTAQGRLSLPVEFLASKTWQPVREADTITVLEQAVAGWHRKPLELEEATLLKKQLEHYSLSATHLNNFLDIVHAGPQTFLEQNLLRFPQPKSVGSAFGSAVHAALHQLSVNVNQTGELPALESLLESFEQYLYQERLEQSTFRTQLERGQSALRHFYTERHADLCQKSESERDFRLQGLRINAVPISGKIDRIIRQDSHLILYDYKTGQPLHDWQGHSANEKIKVRNYRRQLAFYYLLIQQSADYRTVKSIEGCLLFIEPDRKTGQLSKLDLLIEQAEVERLIALIEVVFAKIMALDFPDTSHYAQNLQGTQDFEADLLAHRI